MIDAYHNPTKGVLNLEETVQEIRDYMASDSESRYTLVVGSDSEDNLEVDFITAIVVHRVGHGARYFWKSTVQPRLATLRDRVWQEALLSLETAKELISVLGEGNGPEVEIHVDIGTNGPTKKMIQEVTGMIRGSGFVVRIKPEAYAAASVADRHT